MYILSPGEGDPNFFGRGCSSENFNGIPKGYKSGRGSGRFQALRDTIQKCTCRQHFNQFNEAEDNNYTDMTDINLNCRYAIFCLCLCDIEEALQSTALYANKFRV